MTPDKRPDFSNVQSGFGSTEQAKPDFSNVQAGASSTEQMSPGDTLAERSYTVQKGDTLSHIAKAHYGKPNKWHVIFDANREQLQDPDKIFPGQVLRIPALDDQDGDSARHN